MRKRKGQLQRRTTKNSLLRIELDTFTNTVMFCNTAKQLKPRMYHAVSSDAEQAHTGQKSRTVGARDVKQYHKTTVQLYFTLSYLTMTNKNVKQTKRKKNYHI